MRRIKDTNYRDAASCYPLMPLIGYSDLSEGLKELSDTHAISFVGVIDPHFSPPVHELAATFPICRPFKTHFVMDRKCGPPRWSKHHRYEIRKADRNCSIRSTSLAQVLDISWSLYAEFAARLKISGPANFSRPFFENLSNQDPFLVFVAEAECGVIGFSLWFRHEDIAYYFLNVSSSKGYDLGAAYALMAAACEHYVDCRIINLGGVAGAGDNAAHGLARFKQGFANATIESHLVGTVLDPTTYAALSKTEQNTNWFPAYRA